VRWLSSNVASFGGGGLSNRKRMCWVKWRDICRPKKGGLGIRVMNLSLLAKWRWKLLSEGDEMWRRVVVSKYGGGVQIWWWCGGEC
jgi:hypothetical protein